MGISLYRKADYWIAESGGLEVFGVSPESALAELLAEDKRRGEEIADLKEEYPDVTFRYDFQVAGWRITGRSWSLLLPIRIVEFKKDRFRKFIDTMIAAEAELWV